MDFLAPTNRGTALKQLKDYIYLLKSGDFNTYLARFRWKSFNRAFNIEIQTKKSIIFKKRSQRHAVAPKPKPIVMKKKIFSLGFHLTNKVIFFKFKKRAVRFDGPCPGHTPSTNASTFNPVPFQDKLPVHVMSKILVKAQQHFKISQYVIQYKRPVRDQCGLH